MKIKGSLLLLISILSLIGCAQDKPKVNIDYEVIVPDLSIPWGFAFLPDNSLIITEKEGKLIHFKDGKKTNIEGLPKIQVRGQGGLMDIQLHPNFNSNGWIYFAYASPEGEGDGCNTAIMRAKIENNSLTNKQVLYKASPNSTKGQHFGSRIAFDSKGYLFFSIGERGDRDHNPQDITRDGGKIYRLNDDGSIPNDNPFVNVPNAKKAIYSYGHRNPQGLIFNSFTGEIWDNEHGPQGGDEINVIEPGKNYGWPKISYGINYDGTKFTDYTSLPGMEQPLHYWVPSIAPSGMAMVTSDKYPGWKGNVLVGSLKFLYLDNCYIKDGKVVKEEQLLKNLGRVRTVNQGPDGYIYVGIENLGIVKIIPKK